MGAIAFFPSTRPTSRGMARRPVRIVGRVLILLSTERSERCIFTPGTTPRICEPAKSEGWLYSTGLPQTRDKRRLIFGPWLSSPQHITVDDVVSMSKEAALSNLMHYPATYLEGLKKPKTFLRGIVSLNAEFRAQNIPHKKKKCWPLNCHL